MIQKDNQLLCRQVSQHSDLSHHPKPSYPDTGKQTSGKENKQSQENGFKTISICDDRLSLSSWSAAYELYHIFVQVKHAMVATRQNGDKQILHPRD
jgi:hypothetical protein